MTDLRTLANPFQFTDLDIRTAQPMLATPFNPAKLPEQVFVQPKLDGIRATWDPVRKALFTRNGNKITSCDHIAEAIIAAGMGNDWWDGELYTHDLPFQTINGLVRRKTATAESGLLRFHIFDIINDSPAFIRVQRLQSLLKYLASHNVKHLRVVNTWLVKRRDITDAYQDCLDEDFEGIMIRHPDALYQSGRSQSLMKLKPTQDMEGELIGFDLTDSNQHGGTFGSLVLALPGGRQVKCAGLTEADREKLWQEKPIGQRVTFLFEGVTRDGIPRFPRFKAIREDLGVA